MSFVSVFFTKITILFKELVMHHSSPQMKELYRETYAEMTQNGEEAPELENIFSVQHVKELKLGFMSIISAYSWPPFAILFLDGIAVNQFLINIALWIFFGFWFALLHAVVIIVKHKKKSLGAIRFAAAFSVNYLIKLITSNDFLKIK